MNNEKLYIITVNRDQLMLIANCIEDISRFVSGQPCMTNTLCSMLAKHDNDCTKRDEIEEHLYAVKSIIFPELSKHASYGYNGGSQSDLIRKNLIGNTYQIYREILHFLAVDEKWNNVYSGITLPSGNLGTINIKTNE